MNEFYLKQVKIHNRYDKINKHSQELRFLERGDRPEINKISKFHFSALESASAVTSKSINEEDDLNEGDDGGEETDTLVLEIDGILFLVTSLIKF